jgi:hypothetical protein
MKPAERVWYTVSETAGWRGAAMNDVVAMLDRWQLDV